MKPQLVSTDASLQTTVQIKQDLFNRFGGMLLGYISEVVKSRAKAEKYLVDVFNQLQFADMQAITGPGKNTFIYLQSIAREKLASFVSSVNNCDNVKPTVGGNKFVEMMTPDQQLVFCGLHYHGKTTVKLAGELNKSELEVKQLLKEAFKIIRNNRS